MAARAALKSLDFGKLSVGLNLKQETVAALASFRKRHEQLVRTVAALEEQRSSIDFEHYRSALKNKKVVDDAEKALKAFVPAKFDTQAQLKVIDAFEAKAIASAQQTADRVGLELRELKETLDNIDKARPIDQLTVDDVLKAKPEIEAQVEEMVKNGEWNMPKYIEKFGDMRVV
ncbi:ATP synthase d subunit [Sorochytrium milnesiophthora]